MRLVTRIISYEGLLLSGGGINALRLGDSFLDSLLLPTLTQGRGPMQPALNITPTPTSAIRANYLAYRGGMLQSSEVK